MPRNPDSNVSLGDVHDHEGNARPVLRDFDYLVLPEATLMPAGVRELEKRIADYWNALARYRLRELDFDALGVDLDAARDSLRFYPGVRDENEPGNLELVNWSELGTRVFYGNTPELRKLHALLMADETPATEATS
jgi:hypothetical protein